jgi:hypothetical protein
MTALLFTGMLVAACGDKSDEGRRESASPVSQADEARAHREADENRKRFMGDGKAKYTPQRVDGF